MSSTIILRRTYYPSGLNLFYISFFGERKFTARCEQLVVEVVFGVFLCCKRGAKRRGVRLDIRERAVRICIVLTDYPFAFFVDAHNQAERGWLSEKAGGIEITGVSLVILH